MDKPDSWGYRRPSRTESRRGERSYTPPAESRRRFRSNSDAAEEPRLRYGSYTDRSEDSRPVYRSNTERRPAYYSRHRDDDVTRENLNEPRYGNIAIRRVEARDRNNERESRQWTREHFRRHPEDRPPVWNQMSYYEDPHPGTRVHVDVDHEVSPRTRRLPRPTPRRFDDYPEITVRPPSPTRVTGRRRPSPRPAREYTPVEEPPRRRYEGFGRRRQGMSTRGRDVHDRRRRDDCVKM